MAHLQKGRISVKRIGVDKTNARIVVITAISAFLVIFFIIGSISLLKQLTYQNRIISAKKSAVSQLKSNLTARDNLVESYKTFSNASTNFIGGLSGGSGPQDGNNAKLVLDALPDRYDFPALAASLEKIATDQKVSIDGITGTDDSIAQSKPVIGKPVPIEMPFELKVTGDYASIQHTLDAFDRSIRPVQFKTLDITGDQTRLSIDMSASMYYQPGRTFNLGSKVIK